MSEIFNIGDEGSASLLSDTLQGIHDQGSLILDQLETGRLETLAEFGRRLTSLNGRRQRANLIAADGTAVKFVTTDLLNIDQAFTTASVRCDGGSVSLRERSQPTDTLVRSTRFTASTGVIQSLDSAQQLYTVISSQIPIGTFDIELASPVSLSQVTFDVAAIPSSPSITISASSDGISYSPASGYSLNGYRINSWFANLAARFVRLSITPSCPDTLSGNEYTFGLTSFHSTSTQYQLVSEIVSKPITWNPFSASVRLVVDGDPGITYFLSLGLPGAPASYVEVVPDTAIPLPGTSIVGPTSGIGMVGVTFSGTTAVSLGAYIRPTTPNGFVYRVTTAGTTASSQPTWPTTEGAIIVSGSATFAATAEGLLNYTLSSGYYQRSLKILSGGSPVRVAPDLSYQDTNIAKLAHKYAAVSGTGIRYVHWVVGDLGKTFTISYSTGPVQLQAQLKAQFLTSDRNSTPIFRGAQLEHIL